MTTTINPNIFQIEDVDGDNACLYRALANSLHYRTKKDSTNYLSSKDKVYNNNIKDIYQHKDWSKSGKQQEQLARNIQEKVFLWLKRNKNTIIKEFGITYEDLIESEHGLSFDEYSELYQYFAGDNIVYQDEDGESGDELSDRWGGTPEIIALSHICKLPIQIYTSQTFNKYRNKVITGVIKNNKPVKNVRLKLYQIIGLEYLEKGRPSIYLIWKKSTIGPHYMCMYKK